MLHMELVKKLYWITSKSLVSLTKEKNTFSKIMWDKKFGGKGVFMPCFKLKQLTKKEKTNVLTSSGNKANSSRRTRGLSYWSTFAASAENGGNNNPGFSWEFPCLQKPEWTTLYKAEIYWFYCETNLGLKIQRLTDSNPVVPVCKACALFLLLYMGTLSKSGDVPEISMNSKQMADTFQG